MMEREWGIKETVRFERMGRSEGGTIGDGWGWVIERGEEGMDGGMHGIVRGIIGSGGGSELGGVELRSPSETSTGGRIVMIGR
jgi:hypothetical protein